MPSDPEPIDVVGVAVRVARALSSAGARYALLEAAALGLSVQPERLPELIRAGRQIRTALLRDVYGVMMYQDINGRGLAAPLAQRSVTVFAE